VWVVGVWGGVGGGAVLRSQPTCVRDVEVAEAEAFSIQ
jgi:hypothetical protein